MLSSKLLNKYRCFHLLNFRLYPTYITFLSNTLTGIFNQPGWYAGFKIAKTVNKNHEELVFKATLVAFTAVRSATSTAICCIPDSTNVLTRDFMICKGKHAKKTSNFIIQPSSIFKCAIENEIVRKVLARVTRFIVLTNRVDVGTNI